MNLIRILEIAQIIVTIIVLLSQIPFSVFVFTDKSYTVSNSQIQIINSILSQSQKQFIKNIILITNNTPICNTQEIFISNNLQYCIYRYNSNDSIIVNIQNQCPSTHPYDIYYFDTNESRYCFNAYYNTFTCNLNGVPCYNYMKDKYPLQQINETSILLNYYIQKTFDSNNFCDDIPIDFYNYYNPIVYEYKFMQTIILIIWFINLIFVFGMGSGIFIYYCAKIKTNKYITLGTIKFITVLTMISQSIIGFVSFYTKQKISAYTQDMRSYQICFTGIYQDYLLNFPYYFGNLMDSFVAFLLALSLLLVLMTVLLIVIEIFGRCYDKQQWTMDQRLIEMSQYK